MQVIGDPGVIAEREAGLVSLALDALADLGVACECDGGGIASIGGLELAAQAVEVAQLLMRPAASRLERRIVLGDLQGPLRKRKRNRVGVPLLRLVRRAQAVVCAFRRNVIIESGGT
jgi:hypothetical protein